MLHTSGVETIWCKRKNLFDYRLLSLDNSHGCNGASKKMKNGGKVDNVQTPQGE